MTADPIPAIRAMFTAAGITAPAAARHTTTSTPRIRLDLAGGGDEIIGHHDQALVGVHCFDDDYASADALARDARAAITTGEWAGALVTKARTTPPRYEDGDQFEPAQGVVSFTARVWLHPA